MSSFFSLGFSKQDQEIDTSNNNNNTSFHLFKNEEIYNKGFELWQQYYQLHQQKLLQNQDVEFSITPTTKPINNYNHNNNNNSLCLVNNTSVYDQSEYSRSLNKEVMMMRQGGSGRGSGGNDTINCQDCGNQAKKDCMHMRCRTCCKSRGFHCQTHVKSTWVPAAKRRERQQQLASIQQQQPDQEQQMQQQLAIKRLRENPGGSGSGAAVHSQGFELGHFPAEVNSSAVFRCVRVSSMDEADEHLAYQTAVNIGGHVFKGILYDQGPDTRYPSGGEGPSHSQQQQPHLGLIAGSSGAGTSNNQNPNVTMNEYASIYPAPLNAFMAGTQFFPPPRH